MFSHDSHRRGRRSRAGSLLWSGLLALAVLLPAASWAAPCDDMYPNGSRPTVAPGVPPTPLNAGNLIPLCRNNAYKIGDFGADGAGYFEVSYNKDTGQPNYVAYCMDPTREARLSGKWWSNAGYKCCNPDPAVEVTDQSARQHLSGNLSLDLGHLAPNESMRHSLDGLAAANYLTNTTPMSSFLNKGNWGQLEGWIRTYSKTSPVYVLVGPIFNFAALPLRRLTATPGSKSVALPDAFFMVIYQPKSAANATAKLLVYSFPNSKKRPAPTAVPAAGPPNQADFLVTLASVEAATGFTFNLPANPLNISSGAVLTCGAPLN